MFVATYVIIGRKTFDYSAIHIKKINIQGYAERWF